MERGGQAEEVKELGNLLGDPRKASPRPPNNIDPHPHHPAFNPGTMSAKSCAPDSGAGPGCPLGGSGLTGEDMGWHSVTCLPPGGEKKKSQ